MKELMNEGLFTQLVMCKVFVGITTLCRELTVILSLYLQCKNVLQQRSLNECK